MIIKKIFTVTLLIFSLGTGCKYPDPKDVSDKIKFEASFPINIKEPSGLTLSLDGDNLWVVSDKANKIYLISKDGKIIKDIAVKGKDFEGITQVNENLLAIVNEEDGKIILADFSGNIIKEVNAGFAKKGSSGLEGISYDKNNNRYFIVNEKNPEKLFILDEEFNLINEAEIKKVKDLSGIFYESNENVLWIVSDESKVILKCSISGKVIEEYKIDVPQAEGIAVDFNEKKIYLVSDKTGMLYIYEILQ